MFSFTTIARRAFLLACFCLTLTLYPVPSYALTVQDVPNPRASYDGWVTDMAEILSPVTEIKLNQIISKLERENGSEIAVVTVRETTTSPTPKAFTTKLFNYWKIGKKEQNNGVLFLVSVNEHRIEIETGKGIINILSNADVNSIIQQKIIPQFKQGNFENGILSGTESLVAKLSGDQVVTSQDTANSTSFAPKKEYPLGRQGERERGAEEIASLNLHRERNHLKDEKSFVLFWLLFAAMIVFVVVFWVFSKLSHKSHAKRNYSSGDSNSSFENDGNDSSFNLKMMMYKSNQNHYYFNSTSVAEGHGSSYDFKRSDSDSNSGHGSSSGLSDGDSGSSNFFGCDSGDFGGGSSGGDGGGGDW